MSINVTDKFETIEDCQRRVLELVEIARQGGTSEGDAPDASPVAQEIAHIYIRMGDLLFAEKNLEGTATCYATALQLEPTLSSTDIWLKKYKTFLTEMLQHSPHDINILKLLGDTVRKLGEKSLALDYFQRAFEIDPADGDSLWTITSLQRDLGLKEADATYVRAARIKPLIKAEANKNQPNFSVLVISAPPHGGTRTEYLMKNVPYEVNTFHLFPDVPYDLALLKSCGQITFNAVSEADLAHNALPLVTHLVDQLGMPVLNHPSKIKKTTREETALLLQYIPGCRLAQIVRHNAGEPVTAEALKAKVPFSLPLVARPAGTHSGEQFELIDSFTALEDFIRKNPAAAHYLMEYLDYKSQDGYFRKYRFIFVDGKVMPYHVAIGNTWKVHHGTTDMDKNQWMQDEEKAFLKNPADFFSPQNLQTLDAILQAVGLEYFGIDCGLDQQGNLVVFEVNATMFVHGYNDAFPYKIPYVEAIKKAFNDMLQNRAEPLKRA